jgi:AraC-like DNA-binding protein
MLRAGARISHVAFATGFSDQSHLTRQFKRVLGVTPGSYAQSYRVRVGGVGEL